MKKNVKKTRAAGGLTLVEMIIAMVMVAVIMASVAYTINIIMQSWFAGYQKTDLEQQARHALRQMAGELREATNFYGFNSVAWVPGTAVANPYRNFSQILFSADLNQDGREECIYYYLRDSNVAPAVYCSLWDASDGGTDETAYTLYRAEGPSYDFFLNPTSGFDPDEDGKVMARFIDRSSRTGGTKFQYTGGEAQITLSLLRGMEKAVLSARFKPRPPSNLNVFFDLPWLSGGAMGTIHWYAANDTTAGIPGIGQNDDSTNTARYGTYSITNNNHQAWDVGGDSPFFVSASTAREGLTIHSGQTLVIHGGVTVLFDNNAELYIESGGRLRIDATEANKVVFKALSKMPTANCWRGVTGDNSGVEGAVITGPGQNLSIQDT